MPRANILSVVLIALCCLLIFGRLSPASAAVLQARVVGISDGDTIKVLDQRKEVHKIRLAGIDAPEKRQAFGQRSKQHLSDLVFAKAVNVEYEKRDRYGRIIGKVLVADPECHLDDCPPSLDAGLALIKAGMAWHYKRYQKDQTAEDRRLYGFEEDRAKSERVGLWRDDSSVPPWEFRRHSRK